MGVAKFWGGGEIGEKETIGGVYRDHPTGHKWMGTYTLLEMLRKIAAYPRLSAALVAGIWEFFASYNKFWPILAKVFHSHGSTIMSRLKFSSTPAWMVGVVSGPLRRKESLVWASSIKAN